MSELWMPGTWTLTTVRGVQIESTIFRWNEDAWEVRITNSEVMVPPKEFGTRDEAQAYSERLKADLEWHGATQTRA
jgi:hypothetical protein